MAVPPPLERCLGADNLAALGKTERAHSPLARSVSLFLESQMNNQDGRERGKQLVEYIWQKYEEAANDRRPNGLRPSELGSECERYLWYRYRWSDTFESFPGRLHRLFETGHIQEDRLVNDIKRAGAKVFVADPDDPSKQIPMKMMMGHSKGFLDGVIQGVPFSNHEFTLFEGKSHSEKSFKTLQKDGVETAFPKHFGQMQIYMDEHELKEGVYAAVNKNNDDLYIEFIPYDATYCKRLKEKARRVVYSTIAPSKINESPTFFKCKFCSASGICHKGKLPTRTCRSCRFGRPSKPEDVADHGNGAPYWVCGYYEDETRRLDLDTQKVGCPHHRFLPDLVDGHHTGDDALNATGIVYEYSMGDGSLFYDDGLG
jgi:hypothetical protein